MPPAAWEPLASYIFQVNRRVAEERAEIRTRSRRTSVSCRGGDRSRQRLALPAATSPDTVAPAPAPIRARRVPDVPPLPDGGESSAAPGAGGDDHRAIASRCRLASILRVIVEQHGIDPIAQTRDTARRLPIADFEDEIRHDGREEVELVADARAARYDRDYGAARQHRRGLAYDLDCRPSRGDRGRPWRVIRRVDCGRPPIAGDRKAASTRHGSSRQCAR